MIPGISTTPKVTRVRIDASKCTGHGVCVEVAPDLFALDRFGYAYVRPDAPGALRDDADARARLREAEVRCPDRAILVERVPDVAPEPVVASRAVGDPGPRLLVDGAGADDRRDFRHADPEAFEPAALLDAVDAAGIAGHGGARFPVAAKWRSVGRGDPVVVVNGAEREPGTIKDQRLLETRPFAVLFGAVITARATGATQILVAIDVEHESARAALEAAVPEALEAPLAAGIEIEVRTVPARYVAGEESALIEVLSGRAPLPHVRPPFPTTNGYDGRPTVVHNVETLVQIGLTARHGADWFRAAGTADEPGTGVFSVGRFGAPVVALERPYGTSLRSLVDDAGLGDDVGAVIVGGWSGGVLRPDQLDVGLTHAQLVAVHGALGTKSIQVVPRGTDLVQVAAEVVGYFGAESAGQCPSCTQGLPWIAESLRALAAGTAPAPLVDEVRTFAATLPRRGACALPDGAVRFLQSLFANFPDVVEGHLAGEALHGGRSSL